MRRLEHRFWHWIMRLAKKRVHCKFMGNGGGDMDPKDIEWSIVQHLD
ncbi:hypothetical protein SOVF_043710 [Spinacia oleracea]|nr:hypothetical protein SOVF_043710 [Spinacia oleracea]